MNLTDFKIQNGILTPSPSFRMVDPNYTEPAEVLEAVERCNQWQKASKEKGTSANVSPVVALTWFLQNNSVLNVIGNGHISKNDANNRAFRDAMFSFLQTGIILSVRATVNTILVDQSKQHIYISDKGILSLNSGDTYKKVMSNLDLSH